MKFAKNPTSGHPGRPEAWRRFVPGSRYLRSIAVLTGGAAAGQVITLVASPILTRLYGPADWGGYGVLLSILGISLVATCLRYEVAIPAARDDDEAGDVVALSLLLATILSFLIPAGVFLVRVVHPAWVPGISPAEAWLLVPLLLLNSAWAVLRYWHLRRQGYGVVSRSWVVQVAGRVGTQLACGFGSAGWTGLYAGELVGRTVAVGSFLHGTRDDLLPRLRRATGRGMKAAAVRFRTFAFYGLPSSLVDIAAVMIPVPFLAAVYGREAAGSFALMQRVVAVPMSLVGANVADAFHTRLAVMVRETPERCVGLFRKTFALLAAIGLVPAVVLFLWGRPLFLLVFGPEWGTAGEMATLVVPWLWLQLAVGPLSRLVFVLGGQAPKLVYDLAAFTSVTGVLVVARRSAWSLLGTVKAIAWANAACYLLYLVLLAWITIRWARRSAAGAAGNGGGETTPSGPPEGPVDGPGRG